LQGVLSVDERPFVLKDTKKGQFSGLRGQFLVAFFFEPVFGWMCFHSFVRLFIMKKNTICLYIFLVCSSLQTRNDPILRFEFNKKKEKATNKLASPHQPISVG